MAKVKLINVAVHGETHTHQYQIVNDDGSEITRANGTVPIFNGPGIDMTGECICKFEGDAEARAAHIEEGCDLRALHLAEQQRILAMWNRAQQRATENHEAALAALEQTNTTARA